MLATQQVETKRFNNPPSSPTAGAMIAEAGEGETLPGGGGASRAAVLREIWETHQGDMPGAANALYATVSGSPDLLNAVLPKALMEWCREEVSQYVKKVRVASLFAVTPEVASRGSRLRSAIARTLFDFPLPGGKRLGDANAREILDGANAYSESADDAAHKARWLARVAQAVGRENRAEGALTLQQVEELFEETRDA